MKNYAEQIDPKYQESKAIADWQNVLEKIAAKLGPSELLVHFSMEAAGLSQAALMLRHAMEHENSASLSKLDAKENFQDALAGILLCIAAMGIDQFAVARAIRGKAHSWADNVDADYEGPKIISEKSATVEQWLGYKFATSCETTQEYLAFQRVAKRELKKMAKAAGFILTSFSQQSFSFSAVLQKESSGAFFYVSICDVRDNFDEWYNNVLYRAMRHEKDWSGGKNHYCKWCDLMDALLALQSEPESSDSLPGS